MVKNSAILYPIFVLAVWTIVVLMRVGYVRLTSRLKPSDFKYGESTAVPAHVSLPNRNYMNLLELPVLYYVVCLTLYCLPRYPEFVVILAWAYVVLRIVHSAIHLTYNHVMHRFAAFAASNAVLLVLWIYAGLDMAGWIN